MPFMDTQIIKRRVAAKKNRTLDTAQTVDISGVSYGLRRMTILEGAVSVIVPDCFTEMERIAAEMKYPSAYRPQHILTADDGAISFAFNLLDQPLAKNQTDEKPGELKAAIKRMNPASIFLTEKVEILGDRKAGYFDYKSYALDQDIYSLVFVTDIYDLLLLGMFNCPFEQYKDWKRLVVRMVLSIEEGELTTVHDNTEENDEDRKDVIQLPQTELI